MNRQLPPLYALRAFEVFSRRGSMSAAADELCVTHGAVSRQVRHLEAVLGLSLVEGPKARLRLTEAGRELAARLAPAFDALWEAVDQARAPGPTTLDVSCLGTFAMRWLVPQLAMFYRVHPDIRIRLSMTSAREMRNEGADLLLAWDLSGYPDADRRRAIPLAPVTFAAVCTPEYARLPPRKRTRIAHEYTSSAWDQWEAKAGRSVAR